MSDLTVHAEALIASVARAFYEDDAVCIIDVLLRDKFLRDDDMMPRLSLPAKQLRRTLQFLLEEHIVKFELVDDLSSGGSQATKFWYIDYNHAVNTIRLRIYLLRKKLEKAELRARSSSFYLCPGYKEKRCNGRYTETETQQVVDPTTGLFLCQNVSMRTRPIPILLQWNPTRCN
jgi:transcription initiation factor TFIIE subunit alpha